MAKDYSATADKAIAEALELFDLCVEHESDNRDAYKDDVRFALLEEQWDARDRKNREDAGRPCLTINKLGTHVRQVVNDARQNKPGISVHPVDSGADPKTAEVFSGLIRNIEASSNADVAYDTALESAVVGGFGYLKINTAYTSDDTFDQDIVIERVADPLSIYGDPFSDAADSSDWNTAFDVHYLTKDQFQRKYKGADKVDWTGGDYARLASPWKEDERVLVAAWWSREQVTKRLLAIQTETGPLVMLEDEFAKLRGTDPAFATAQVIGDGRDVTSHKVTQRIMSGCEVLETVEWAGKYIPIVPVYGTEVVLDGKRHFRSLVRSAKDAQRMFNYWRTTTTELVALAPKAPWIGRKGAFETDADKWATANTANHAHLEYDGAEKPTREPFAGVPAGALQEALNASDDIKSIIGQYDASLGARSNETSGRAIMARQREGDVATFHYTDNLSRAIRHAGRIIIDLIPKVYNTERIVRVLGADGKAENVPVNQEVEVPDEQGLPVSRTFDLTAGKYDLTVKAGPSYTTQREMVVDTVTQLIQAYPPAAPILGPMLLENMDIPGIDKVVAKIEAQAEQQGQGDPAAALDAQAKMAELQAKTQEAQAKAVLETRKLEIDAYDAETKRLQVVHQMQQPTQAPRTAAE